MNEAGSKSVVYIVDDDEQVLRMLRHLIGVSRDIEARAYHSADDFIAAYRPGASECLVSDICMPGIGGLELQKRLKLLGLNLPIIFISGCAEVPGVVEAMKQGALDYLTKPFASRDLLEKVQEALARSRELHAARQRQAQSEASLQQLTPKERQIARLVVEGGSSREISERLCISIRTVDNHRARIMEKLQVRSAVELVRRLL